MAVYSSPIITRGLGMGVHMQRKEDTQVILTAPGGYMGCNRAVASLSISAQWPITQCPSGCQQMAVSLSTCFTHASAQITCWTTPWLQSTVIIYSLEYRVPELDEDEGLGDWSMELFLKYTTAFLFGLDVSNQLH